MTTDGVMRVRRVRGRLAREGAAWSAGNGLEFETVSLPEDDCDRLRDLLLAERAASVVEIGLAYASSALAIGEALLTVGAPDARHVIVDPFQDSVWAGAGWSLLCEAGLDAIARLVPAWSSIALPGLLTDGFVADAAFVDGSHRFHEVFVDAYFLRKIVRPGGLIVLDDYWAPSVRTAAAYFERNLGWTALPDAIGGDRCQAFRLPAEAYEPPFRQFEPF
nr:hypothetical protein GCM10020063_016470 [Dactylosporangium thailandense]